MWTDHGHSGKYNEIRFYNGAIGMGRKHGFSFSWKRATGISGMKSRVSRKTGIPLTRSGRQRKVGRAAGCCVPLAFMTICAASVCIGLKAFV